MPHKFDIRKKNVLLTPERQEELQPERLLRDLGLEPGDVMADIGCGPGFFTLPAARIVGAEGRVFAADIQGEMLSTVKSRAAEEHLSNVRVVKTSDTEIPLPPESCDFVLLAFVLNEVPQRAHFLHRSARLLKRDGRLAILEWEKKETPYGPPLEDRITPDELAADAEAAGVQVTERRSLSDMRYVFVAAPRKR